MCRTSVTVLIWSPCLWSRIFGRANLRSRRLLLERSSSTKVYQLQVGLAFVQNDVVCFHITMYDPSLMQIVNGTQQLCEKPSTLLLFKGTLTDGACQRLAGMEGHDDGKLLPLPQICQTSDQARVLEGA